MKTCLQCEGKGYYLNLSRRRVTCEYCGSRGYVPAPDIDELIEAVTTSRGASKGKRRFRQSPPNKYEERFSYKGARAYFVWRLARFHGGADVTMPIEAEMVIRHDPYGKELDAIASAIARTVFGTDLAAAYRWGALLGKVKPNEIPDGLPLSAYPNGPVVPLGDKPEEEIAELIF